MHWKNWKNFHYFVSLVVAAAAVEAVGVEIAGAGAVAADAINEFGQKN